ncbi:hypothetical protein GFS24_24535 [Chitinophaga sp. SYP-B3965]|uniref:hypothetical protein n=1 Tax=Chitinophaga sp. SYP-B3965 TaxID=2663120 RepID=UPI0012996B4C|nr:hypothetical protein [Chitinophaga sp. SYP-B3965]MRG48306.1 hypothetical protein [Chitinophaga sp. SYP-B3965]
MRILHSLPAVLISLMLTTGVQAQDETGLPGDNFSLEGALEMFKKAENPGEFEKMLNTRENGVNNLDLNQDGDIDYIRVVNKKDGDVQLFVLQALVSSSESQDIAVIELEKTGDDRAVVQIVGDEDIYGVSKIVEPSDKDEVAAFNDDETVTYGSTSTAAAFAPSGLVVNVWFWPSVRFVYAPYYSVWASPWRWYHYPTWFRPWRPLAWDVYQPICYRYRPRYVVIHTHRIVRAPYIYRPIRARSVSVYNRNRVVVNNYRTNYHRSAPSRQYDHNRSTPSRQFDRNTNRSVPSRQFDRNADRSTPSRQFDRNVDRSAPSRQFDRNADRSAPTRQFDRNVDRSTPSRPAERSTPSRQFDRNVDRSTPSRPADRNVERTAPSRQFDRNPNVNRSAPSPSRQFDRAAPAARPQGGQINRSPRSVNPSPQRSTQHSRPSRQRS